MRIVVLAASLALAGCPSESVAKSQPVTTQSDVRAEIVAYSRGGTCTQNAYVTPGGTESRCYRTDVTAEDSKRWRELVRASAAQ